MRHAFFISTGSAPFHGTSSTIYPCFLIAPFLDHQEEGRFFGCTDVVTIHDCNICYRKEVFHAKDNGYYNGWFYPDEWANLPGKEIIQKAIMEVYSYHYDSLTDAQRKELESLKERFYEDDLIF